jgi:hypothetical protein
MRIRAISGRISTRALSSIYVRQTGVRVCVQHLADQLLGCALRQCAEELGAEVIVAATERRLCTLGLEFQTKWQADLYFVTVFHLFALGEYALQAGKEWVS